MRAAERAHAQALGQARAQDCLTHVVVVDGPQLYRAEAERVGRALGRDGQPRVDGPEEERKGPQGPGRLDLVGRLPKDLAPELGRPLQ